MRVSASIELVWNMAVQEAIATEFSEIQIEHFLEALLKFSELPADEVSRLAPNSGVAREMLQEIANVRKELVARGIESTPVRRRLRTTLGGGRNPFKGSEMHRSQAARDMFDAAATLADAAQSEALAADHLLLAILAAPTPAMRKVMGELLEPKPPAPVQTPLLDRQGRDLVRMAAEGTLPKADGRPECDVLLRLMGSPSRPAMLLLTETEGTAQAVAAGAAHVLAGPDCPAGLKGKRIIDVTQIAPAGPDPAEALRQLESLLTEAACAPQVVVLAPSIGAPSASGEATAWVKLLGKALAAGPVQFVCEVHPEAYRRWIGSDPEWKRRTQAVSVGQARNEEIPWEL